MMDKEAILKRIKALLDKTTDNGCTEAEALSAMAKARVMMERHGISEADLHTDMNDVKVEGRKKRAKYKVSFEHFMSVRLAEYCDVKVWHATNSRDLDGYLSVLGAEADRVFFRYLMDYLIDFVDRQANQYAKAEIRKVIELGLKPSHKDSMTAWNFFAHGCMARINERLKEEADKRKVDVKLSDGRSLVVLKSAIVEDAFAKLGIGLSKRSTSNRSIGDMGAYISGIKAGNNASFNRQVGGSYEGTKLIN